MAIYLDYAAATPVDPAVLAAMLPFFTENFYNPSAMYSPALQASAALEGARSDIAQCIGAKQSEIIFTAGGTEANNIAIHGIMSNYADGEVAISAVEHDSVRRPAQQYKNIEIVVTKDGLVDPNTIVISDQTVLVSVMYANNEVGTVQPIRRIAAKLDQIRSLRAKEGNKTPLYFHVDAAQAGNYLDLHVSRLGVDMMTINGGKLYGPKQAGVLFVKSGVHLKPLIQGGGQERNLRSGTENVAHAVGMAKALQTVTVMRQEESRRLQQLQGYFIKQLKAEFPNVIINGSLKYRLPNNVHVTLPGTDNERILMALDMQDIYAAAGSACSASHDEPSHVLGAMGYSTQDIQSSVRFSMGQQTQQDDIDRVVSALKQILA